MLQLQDQLREKNPKIQLNIPSPSKRLIKANIFQLENFYLNYQDKVIDLSFIFKNLGMLKVIEPFEAYSNILKITLENNTFRYLMMDYNDVIGKLEGYYCHGMSGASI